MSEEKEQAIIALTKTLRDMGAQVFRANNSPGIKDDGRDGSTRWTATIFDEDLDFAKELMPWKRKNIWVAVIALDESNG